MNQDQDYGDPYTSGDPGDGWASIGHHRLTALFYESGEDQDTVDDRWSRLLSLIAQYGGERYALGWQDGQAMMRGESVKRDITGEVEPGSLMRQITHEILTLQREIGDD